MFFFLEYGSCFPVSSLVTYFGLYSGHFERYVAETLDSVVPRRQLIFFFFFNFIRQLTYLDSSSKVCFAMVVTGEISLFLLASVGLVGVCPGYVWFSFHSFCIESGAAFFFWSLLFFVHVPSVVELLWALWALSSHFSSQFLFSVNNSKKWETHLMLFPYSRYGLPSTFSMFWVALEQCCSVGLCARWECSLLALPVQ